MAEPNLKDLLERKLTETKDQFTEECHFMDGAGMDPFGLRDDIEAIERVLGLLADWEQEPEEDDVEDDVNDEPDDMEDN